MCDIFGLVVMKGGGSEDLGSLWYYKSWGSSNIGDKSISFGVENIWD